MTINILHLSDIHFTVRRKADQRIVFDALFNAIAKDAGTDLKPDLIVLSGDLVNSADEADAYGHFLDDFLQPLLKAANCGDTRIVLTPGNHDIPREFVEAKLPAHHGNVDLFRSRDELNGAFSAGHLNEFIEKKFERYRTLRSLLQPPLVCENRAGSLYDYPELGIAFLELNSSWAGYGGIRKIEDLRHLFIPEVAVSELINQVPNGRFVVLITHHPLSWLDEANELDIRRTLGNRAGLHLFGHMHEENPQQTVSLSGELVAHQVGAVFTHRDRHQGYAVIRLAPEGPFFEFNLRTYYEARREFGSSEDLIEGGVFYPSAESKAFFHRQSRKIDTAKLDEWRQGSLRGHLTLEYSNGLVDKPIAELFVPPPLYAREANAVDEDDTGQGPEVDVQFASIVNSAANYIIHGKPEYGKTTLLQRIALGTLECRDADGSCRAPAVLAFPAIKAGTDRIEGLIRQSWPELPDKCPLRQLLHEGLVTVLIDDVNFLDTGRFRVLAAFMSKYPRVRYVLTTADQTITRFNSVIDPETPVNFEHAFIRSLRRRDMRALIERWDPAKKLDQEELLNRVVSDIKHINVPMTAINGTILLSIFESHADFTPINRSTLIERFIEVLLEKRAVAEIARKTFDFRNRTHFLSALSKHMALTDAYVLSEADVLTFAQGYMRNLGLPQNPATLIEELTTARILSKNTEGHISFRYRAFLEYFIARQMTEDADFRDWVLEEQRYISFPNEIQYYAGIGRNDETLLNLLGDRFTTLTVENFESLTSTANLDSLKKLQLPGKADDSAKILASVEAAINAPSLTAAERDELLEADLPQDVEGRQEVFRPQPKDEGSFWLSLLFMYSNVMRDTELISDQTKRRHLQAILNAWGFFTILSLWAIPNLAKHRKLSVNGMRYEVRMPARFTDGETARFLLISLPTAVTRMVFATLGTPKLQEQISESADNPGEREIVTFLRSSLGMDLQLPHWLDRVEGFFLKIGKQTYMSQVMLWKLGEAHLRLPLGPETLMRLRNIMADKIAALRGGKKDEQKRLREKKLQFFHQRELVNRLTTRNDDDRGSRN